VRLPASRPALRSLRQSEAARESAGRGPTPEVAPVSWTPTGHREVVDQRQLFWPVGEELIGRFADESRRV